MNPRLRTWLGATLSFAALCLPLAARAEFPEKAIKIVVPYAAGGSLDITTRLLAERIRVSTGQPVIVENITGASGNLGTQAVARAAPDGYTVLMQTVALTIGPWLHKPNFDAQRDLILITRPAVSPYLMAAAADKSPRTLDELLAMAKADPGKPACSSYGVGSPPHLALEMLKQAAKVDILHVPYRGFGLALPDVMSGQLACGFDSLPNVLPHVRSGKLRALAVTSKAPMASLPGVPTMTSKFPGLEVEGWQGVFVPAKTPRAVLEKLNAEFVKALRDPEVERRLAEIGFTTVGDSLESAAAIFKADYERYGEIIRSRNIQAE